MPSSDLSVFLGTLERCSCADTFIPQLLCVPRRLTFIHKTRITEQRIKSKFHNLTTTPSQLKTCYTSIFPKTFLLACGMLLVPSLQTAQTFFLIQVSCLGKARVDIYFPTHTTCGATQITSHVSRFSPWHLRFLPKQCFFFLYFPSQIKRLQRPPQGANRPRAR
jgi:hypothetical protein